MPARLSVSPPSLVFPSAYHGEHTVTVTALDDAIVEPFEVQQVISHNVTVDGETVGFLRYVAAGVCV